MVLGWLMVGSVLHLAGEAAQKLQVVGRREAVKVRMQEAVVVVEQRAMFVPLMHRRHFELLVQLTKV